MKKIQVTIGSGGKLVCIISLILLQAMTPIAVTEKFDSTQQTAKKKVTTVTIQVSIDLGGNITCTEPEVPEGSEVTWEMVGPGTITAITQGDAFTATPTNSHGWSATAVSTTGEKTYSITVQPPGGQAKQKAPKIGVVA
jgi:hypothetical protein